MIRRDPNRDRINRIRLSSTQCTPGVRSPSTARETEDVAEAQPKFVGRSAELAALAALLDRSIQGDPMVAFIEGEAGIGKSRLLHEIADQVHAHGGMVLRGSAPPPAGQPLPFAAISQVLRDVLRQLPEAERDALIIEVPHLAHLQPAWRVADTAIVAPASLTSLCEEVLHVVDRVARDRPLIAILLDDLQWADAATLDLITYAARSPRESRIALILAARVDETGADSPIRRVRAELLRSGASSLRLEPLVEDEAGQMLQAVTSTTLAPGRRRRIAQLGRGNPLFLQELAAAAERGPEVLPESLVALVGVRLASLSETQRAVLRVVSVAIDGVPTDLVLRILAGPVDATLGDLRRLLDGGLLRTSPDGSVSVAHPLLREIVISDMLDSERRLLNGAIARVLAAEPALDAGTELERLVRLAHHWDAAGDRVRAVPALFRAADAAERAFAFTTAFDLYRRTLEYLASTDHDTDTRKLGFRTPSGTNPRPVRIAGGPSSDGAAFADLRRRAADAAILAGEPDVALDWIDAALAEVAPSNERDQLELARARTLLALGDAPAAVHMYEDVIRRIDPPSPSALIGLARALVAAGREQEGVTAGENALLTARAGRSKTEEGAALLVLGTALTAAGDLEAGSRRLHEAQSLRHEGTSESAIRPRVSRVVDLTAGLADAARVAYGAGLRSDANTLADDAAAAASRWGADSEGWSLQVGRAATAFDDGRWDAALAILDELVEYRGSQIAALTLRARIGALRGSWDRTAADLALCEGAVLIRSRPQDRAAFSIALTELRLGRREIEAATDAATEGLVLASGAPAADRLELIALATRAHVDATLTGRALRAGVEAGEHEGIARALCAEAARVSTTAPKVRALIATIGAETARLGAGGGSSWAEARSAWEVAGSAWWIAYAGMREAEAWLGIKSRRDAARDALTRARGAAVALEASPLLTEIDSLATRGRLELPSEERAAPTPRADRKLPVSDRELEVLVLIAKGLTNKEIAAELFISERTAAHHVGHIFDKLGVSSRVEAAGAAHRAGVLVEGTN